MRARLFTSSRQNRLLPKPLTLFRRKVPTGLPVSVHTKTASTAILAYDSLFCKSKEIVYFFNTIIEFFPISQSQIIMLLKVSDEFVRWVFRSYHRCSLQCRKVNLRPQGVLLELAWSCRTTRFRGEAQPFLIKALSSCPPLIWSVRPTEYLTSISPTA